eukprot:1438142-Rhodomonas_salina.3
MRSSLHAVSFPNGSAVCPRGSVLALDQPTQSGARAGACVECKPGQRLCLPTTPCPRCELADPEVAHAAHSPRSGRL